MNMEAIKVYIKYLLKNIFVNASLLILAFNLVGMPIFLGYIPKDLLTIVVNTNELYRYTGTCIFAINLITGFYISRLVINLLGFRSTETVSIEKKWYQHSICYDSICSMPVYHISQIYMDH